MKIPSTLPSRVQALLLSVPLVLTSSVTALERPPELAEPKANVDQAPNERPGEVENQVPKPVEKVAMLGVGGSPASDTLSLHLGLTEGAGLTVFHVVPNSAAAKAGIEKHDIITAINDVNIGSQKDLREVVLAQNPGDEVVIKILHKGKVEEKKIALGERVVAKQRGRASVPRRRRAPRGDIDHDLMRMLRGMGANIPEVDHLRVEEEMQKHLQQMQRHLQENGDIQLDREEGFEMRRGIQMLGGTSMTVHDNDGSVTIKTLNDKKEVIVRDETGKLVYEGPYETAQDKAAVPDDIAERIKRVDLDMQDGGMKLKIGPGGVIPIPEKGKDDLIE